MDGKVLRRREDAVTLAASGVTSIGDFRDAELLAGADPKRTVAVFELLRNGAVSARQVVGFVEARTRYCRGRSSRPPCPSKATTIDCGWKARRMCVRRGSTSVRWTQVEENLLDLLPGETRDIAVRGPVDLVTLREALRVKTLSER